MTGAGLKKDKIAGYSAESLFSNPSSELPLVVVAAGVVVDTSVDKKREMIEDS